MRKESGIDPFFGFALTVFVVFALVTCIYAAAMNGIALRTVEWRCPGDAKWNDLSGGKVWAKRHSDSVARIGCAVRGYEP